MTAPAVVTTESSAPDVNGPVNLRKTHPNLYRILMGYAVLFIAHGLNFWLLAPTFWIYDMPNYLWGTIFLSLGIAELVLLNFWRRLRVMRAIMGFASFYLLFLGAGTMQPAFEGQGSLQLPIWYLGGGAFLIALLLEPYFNPVTARHD